MALEHRDSEAGLSLGPVWEDYLAAAAREKERARNRDPSAFPHFSDEGRWTLLDVEHRSRWQADFYDHGNWTAGFWFGVMWLLVVGSGDDEAARAARDRLPTLIPRAEDATTHDLGFLFYPSLVFPEQVGVLDFESAAPALVAARTTVRRYNPRGDYLQAFGPIGDSRWAGTSTIDTMMNLPLLWWACARGEDGVVYDIARRHARTSARLFLRPDASSYHLNGFDPISGAIIHRGTFQGAGDVSCWSRGQAWAGSGFAWAYGVTLEPEFLQTSERALDYFLERLPPSGVAPWDFSDRSPDATRDASASAIAALGALILGTVHPTPARAARYRKAGCELLARLGENALNRDPDVDGILLHSCYSKPHDLGVDGATGWGDFFFGLALAVAVGAVDVDALVSTRTPIGGPVPSLQSR